MPCHPFSRLVLIAALIVVTSFSVVARAGDLELKLFADEDQLDSPVAISVDDHGRAYVTITARRKESDLDIRKHRGWVTDELSFTHTDEHRAFLRKQLDPSRSKHNKWLRDWNGDGTRDWTDLKVQAERVKFLADTDGDGRADQAKDFAVINGDEMTGTCAGVLWHDGDVYVTCMPRLWKMRDTDNDGVADEREELVYGLGVHLAYGGHDVHGLTVGPDGRIYWSLGDLGFHITKNTRDGKPLKYPNHGAVLRCEPDGSNVEVFAFGLRNPQELAFDEYGNLFSVDNDADKGDKERFVYITQGSDTGWRINWQFRGKGEYNPWTDEKLWVPHFEGQAAYIVPPIRTYNNGPTGFKYNPGGALNDKYQKHFFLTEFPGKTLSAFRTEPNGATFKMVGEHAVVKGNNFVGIAWGPDGALWLADWSGGGWNPGKKGRVWRLDDWSVAGSSKRQEVATLLREGMSKRSTRDLVALLGHFHQRVRLLAQFELVKRGDVGSLARVANDASSDRLARVHAIWGVGQFGRRDKAVMAKVAGLLGDKDDEIRVQVAKMIGDARYAAAGDSVVKMVGDSNPRVRFFGATVAGELGVKSAFGPVVGMLAANDGKDTQLRHAGVMGLVGAADAEQIAGLTSHASRAVRLAAVVALRRQADAKIAAFLDDTDELVVAEAARAIHDDWSIPAALPVLAAVLDRDGLKNEPLLRRAINANLRSGRPANVERLLRYASRADAPSKMRAEALSTVAAWTEASQIDRVDGRYRPRPSRSVTVVHRSLDKSAEDLVSRGDNRIHAELAKVAAATRYHGLGDAMFRLVRESDSADTRREALRALAAMRHGRAADAVKIAMDDKDKNVRREAQSLLKKVGSGGDAVATLTKVIEKGSTQEKQGAFTTLASIDDEKAVAVLAEWMDRLVAGKVPPPFQLDVLEAAKLANNDTLRAKVKAYEATLPAGDMVAPLRVALQGGDAANGATIFEHHIAAQCIRCHTVKGKGGEVAPDLTRIAATKDRQYLLESLIVPQKVVAEGYGTISLILKDGGVATGTIRSEKNGTITLLTADGKTRSVDASKVSQRTPPVSSMPPMGAILTPRELRDVIEYLMTLR